MIEEEALIYRSLAHLNLLAPGNGPRAPPGSGLSGPVSPASVGPRELIYESVYDLPVRRTQTGDLPWPDPA